MTVKPLTINKATTTAQASKLQKTCLSREDLDGKQKQRKAIVDEIKLEKIYKGRFYIMCQKNIPANEPVVEKKAIVNCPKCSTSLNVKIGDYAHLCPVCGQVFRARLGERLVKDISYKPVVEALATDKE